jgi:type III pantothenate kinase
MLLAIDIGNSHTVIGVFDETRLTAEWRLSSGARRTDDELWQTLKGLFNEGRVEVGSLTASGIASVVPELTQAFATVVRSKLGVEPTIVSGTLDLGFRVLYADPSSVGADRICNAVAGYRKYGGPLIIIDFGTATTFDVVAANGDYLGGAISLGVESLASELHRRAARLPRIELKFPPAVIGTDTVSSMQAGVLFGAADAVEGMVRRIRQELGADARVIATGGLSSLIAPRCPSIERCEPALVLEGIRLICEMTGAGGGGRGKA